MRKASALRSLALFVAVALLAACPKRSSHPAQEVPVEIDWPDAALSPPPAATADAESAKPR